MSSENRRAALIAAASTNQAQGLASAWGARRGKVLSIAHELAETLDLLDAAEEKGIYITWEWASELAIATVKKEAQAEVPAARAEALKRMAAENRVS